MNWLLTHGLIAAVAGGVPLLVVAVVAGVARRIAGVAVWEVSGRRLRRLAMATVATWAGFGVWLAVDSEAVAAGRRGMALGAVELIVFAVLFVWLAIPAMSAISGSLPAPGAPELARAATLVPRSVRRYLTWPALSLPYLIVAVAVVIVGVRLSFGEMEGRQNLGAVVVGAGAVLVALYGIWVGETVRRPQVLPANDDTGAHVQAIDRLRRAQIITIHRWQVGLAVVLGPAGVALTYIDFSTSGISTAGVAILALSTLVAAAGCARALTSAYFRNPIHKPT